MLLFLDMHQYNYKHLEYVNMEGISSIKNLTLRVESIENGGSFGNLNQLNLLSLKVKSEINNALTTKLFEICPNIEYLFLNGQFSNVNLLMNLLILR